MLPSECIDVGGRRTAGPRDTRAQAELERLVLVQSEIEMAFTSLRMAEAEIHGGNSSRAAALISKAILAHKTAIKCLAGVPSGLEDEKRELQSSARKLLEAIRGSERQFGILQMS